MINNQYAIRTLATAENAGLTDSEVLRSRDTHGGNVLVKKKRKSFIRKFFENFGDPMIKILLIALGVNLLLLFRDADWYDSLGIGIAILIATLVSTISEYGSEAAFEKLSAEAAAAICRVRRNGRTEEVPVGELVVDDLVLLSAGDRVPADGFLIKGELDVDQSALNGESKEAHKRAGGSGQLPERVGEDFLAPSTLFSASVVSNGEGILKVAAVGAHTFYGKLADEIQDDSPKSPLKIKLEQLAKKISVFGYVGAILVALSYLFYTFIISNNFDGQKILADISDWRILLPHLLNMLTLSVTVIVMAVPEGLPMMITVVMSSNMRRMFKDNVLVRKLTGIETAGSMNILFTDKTGTLTNGKLNVVDVVFGNGERKTPDALKGAKQPLANILAMSLKLNNASELSGGRAIGGNATDRALLEFACMLPDHKGKINKKLIVPFSSEYKFMCTALSGDLNMTLVKGAPEKIIEKCTMYFGANGEAVPLGSKENLYKKVRELSENAIRMIAVATCDSAPDGKELPEGLCLVALVGIRDQIRPEAKNGVGLIQDAGIQTVMITGDSKITAAAIAKEVGIIRSASDLVLTSDEFARMSDAKVAAILPSLRVLARALPSDKSRLVKIAQSLNMVAGMTGDGINDAPALKIADIGFAMGSGTEIAKEAGDIVILDDNLMSIAKAVSYGRTIFKSIRKFLIFELSTNFCAVAISVIAPLLGIGTPITVVQMLWINLVMDTLAGLAFAGERPRLKYMKENPKKRDEPLINKYMWSQIAVASCFTSIVSLTFLKGGLAAGLNETFGAAYGPTAFFTLFMFIAIFNSLNVRTHELNLFSYLSANKQFIAIMGVITLIQIGLIYLGGRIFNTVGLHITHLLMIIGFAMLIIPIDLVRKLIFKKRALPAGT